MKKKNYLLAIAILIIGLVACSDEENVKEKEDNMEATSSSEETETEADDTAPIPEVEGNEEVETDESGYPEKLEGEDLQETASAVQHYVVNLVNNLTIIEVMQSELHRAITESRIYPEEIQTGPPLIEQIAEKTDFLIQASNQTKNLVPPAHTDYMIFDTPFKDYAVQVLNLSKDIQTAADKDSVEELIQLVDEMRDLVREFNELHRSLGITIGQNNYREYEALVQVWNTTNMVAGDSISGGVAGGLWDVGLNIKDEID